MLKKAIFVGFIGVVGLVALISNSNLKSKENSVANVRSSATLNTPGVNKTLTLPQATDDNAGVISLGTGVDPRTGKQVEGLAFIHYKKEFAKPSFAGVKGVEDKCYSFLGKGAKWKTVEPWIMNPNNSRSLDLTNLFDLQSRALAKWDNQTSASIFDSGTLTSEPLSADTLSPDEVNEIYFANIDSPGAIAVTIVWGIFSGPLQLREIVEWDQVYDDMNFDWSLNALLSGEENKMDFDNIATHENGHSSGLGHPSDSCIEETMYRFSSTGETKKRDLNTGDIKGIKALYPF